MRAVLIAAAIVAAGCGRSRSSEPAPVVIAMPGNASGAWWDATTTSLYVTQDGAIVRWSNDQFSPVVDIPGAKGLGAIVKLTDGRLVVTAFGFGNEGGIYIVANGTVTRVPGLDSKRRRTGLALAPDGDLYVSYFLEDHGAKGTGGIARVDLATGETDVVTSGLVKPVGLAATRLALFATDQEASSLLSYARVDPASSRTVVTHDLAQPDLMTMLPNGDLAIASKTGVVYVVTPAGSPREIAHGLGPLRGVAYDPAGKRLFVVEHGGSGGPSRLHALAVE